MTSTTWTLIPVSLHSFSTDAPSVAISIDAKLSKSITIWGFPTLAYPDLNAAGLLLPPALSYLDPVLTPESPYQFG